jgi:hypothetical protein
LNRAVGRAYIRETVPNHTPHIRSPHPLMSHVDVDMESPSWLLGAGCRVSLCALAFATRYTRVTVTEWPPEPS